MGDKKIALPKSVKKALTPKQALDGGAFPGEYIIDYNKSPGEMMIKQGDSYIILGKDRPAGPGSGGSMETGTATIDMVVGRMGFAGKDAVKKNLKVQADPDMLFDLARIYISERCNIDDNFLLTPHFEDLKEKSALAGFKGFVGAAKNKSAIALKATNLRLLSREGIKLITMVDKNRAEDGKPIAGKYGIDLIGGLNTSDTRVTVQPLVKGHNLVRCLLALITQVESLDTAHAQAVKCMTQIVTCLTSHIHLAPGFGAPTTPDVNPVTIATNVMSIADMMFLAQGLGTNQINHASFRKYLFGKTEDSICSAFNTTT